MDPLTTNTKILDDTSPIYFDRCRLTIVSTNPDHPLNKEAVKLMFSRLEESIGNLPENALLRIDFAIEKL